MAPCLVILYKYAQCDMTARGKRGDAVEIRGFIVNVSVNVGWLVSQLPTWYTEGNYQVRNSRVGIPSEGF